MINVLALIQHLRPGGAERMFVSLARSLQYKEGIRIHVAVFLGGGLFEKDLEEVGITVYRLDKERGMKLGRLISVRRLCRDLKIDILHMHEFSAAQWGRAACLGLKRPVRLVTDHTVSGWKNPVKHLIVNRILLHGTGKIVTVSRAAMVSLIKREGVPEERLRVIYNGVEPCQTYRTGRQKDKPLIGYAGRLSEEKGCDVFLESVLILKAAGISFQAVLAGDGPMRPELEKMVTVNGLTPYISFTGALPHGKMLNLIEQLDIAVLPSRQENCSIALLEYMAVGLPSVVTSAGGSPELVINGETGFCVPVNDPVALAEALLRLLRDEALRQRMGEAAKIRYFKKFTVDKMASDYLTLYSELTGNL
jgi:glycosyltransferase involved in cell wall biosynthesis